MMLAFIQNIGVMEWLVLGFCAFCCVAITAAVVLRTSRRRGLEERVERLEQIVDGRRPGR